MYMRERAIEVRPLSKLSYMAFGFIQLVVNLAHEAFFPPLILAHSAAAIVFSNVRGRRTLKVHIHTQNL